MADTYSYIPEKFVTFQYILIFSTNDYVVHRTLSVVIILVLLIKLIFFLLVNEWQFFSIITPKCSLWTVRNGQTSVSTTVNDRSKFGKFRIYSRRERNSKTWRSPKFHARWLDSRFRDPYSSFGRAFSDPFPRTFPPERPSLERANGR